MQFFYLCMYSREMIPGYLPDKIKCFFFVFFWGGGHHQSKLLIFSRLCLPPNSVFILTTLTFKATGVRNISLFRQVLTCVWCNRHQPNHTGTAFLWLWHVKEITGTHQYLAETLMPALPHTTQVGSFQLCRLSSIQVSHQVQSAWLNVNITTMLQRCNWILILAKFVPVERELCMIIISGHK